jgi:hypothetical protein
VKCKTKPSPAVDRGCQGRNVRNKAKPGRSGASGGTGLGTQGRCAKQTKFLDCGLGTDLPLRPARVDCAKQTQFGWSAGAPEGAMRKTNPIPAELDGTGARRRGANMQNGPNFRQGGPPGPAYCTKQSQFPAGWVGRGRRGGGRGTSVRNKANLAAPPGLQGHWYKQSQFPSRARKTIAKAYRP